MKLFDPIIAGPKPGQITRSILVKMPLNSKKSLFYIECQAGAEEEYKQRINYDNPDLLKYKEESVVEQKFPPLDDIEIPVSAFTLVRHRHLENNSDVSFDFSYYKTVILSDASKRLIDYGLNLSTACS